MISSRTLNTPSNPKVKQETGAGQHFEEHGDGSRYQGDPDLDNFQPGDGKRFKGVGPIQLTGRRNYSRFSAYIHDPEVIKQGYSYVLAKYPVQSSCHWWLTNGVNEVAEKGHVKDDLTKLKYAGEENSDAVTKIVNGTRMHAADTRRKYFREAYDLFAGVFYEMWVGRGLGVKGGEMIGKVQDGVRGALRMEKTRVANLGDKVEEPEEDDGTEQEE